MKPCSMPSGLLLADHVWLYRVGYSEQILSTLHPFSIKKKRYVCYIEGFLLIGSPSMANVPLKWHLVGLAGQALTKAWRCRAVVSLDGDSQSFAQPQSKTREITNDFCLKRYQLHNRVAPSGCPVYADVAGSWPHVTLSLIRHSSRR